MAWLRGVCFDFLAQAAHEHPKVRRIGGVRRAPYRFEQLQVRQDPVRVLAQMNQQAVFQWRQVQRDAGALHDASVQINLNVGEGQDRAVLGIFHAPA